MMYGHSGEIDENAVGDDMDVRAGMKYGGGQKHSGAPKVKERAGLMYDQLARIDFGQ